MTDPRPLRILAGDIGGTKTRLALFSVRGTALESLAEERFASRDHDSLAAIIRIFRERHKTEPPHAACFGIAGPVDGGRAAATNLPWRIDAAELARRFRIPRVDLLNDLEANAWGIPALSPADIHELHPGAPGAAGNAAVIAAGTGLGEAGMYWDGDRLHPFATEGGHTGFAPATELEIELLRFLQRDYDHVSWERVVSGPGLVAIHRFLTSRSGQPPAAAVARAMEQGDPAAAISAAADDDPVCGQALELFVHLYGVEAGNLALKQMALGGLYLGGGIAPKILPRLQRGPFLDAFFAKGRMRPLLERMPVRVILNDRTALYGPALYAATRSG
ncbi:MAG TPA: glucokinase [Sedimenticola thiotaurini]|uniref:Glucokinase n=1 Tax=Sedimenticola thiotaurini TaxID=1543721 RepID=A0A831RMC4_9GAMM|nr:glucokinase [Sedimenticola thiotaurini]